MVTDMTGMGCLPVEFVNSPLPRSVEGRRPRARLGVVIEWISRIPNPCNFDCEMVLLANRRENVLRTKAAERVAISELRSVIGRNLRAVPTGGDCVVWFRVIRAIAVVCSGSSVRIPVVFGFDNSEVNRQDNSENNKNESCGRGKPEHRSPEQGLATFGQIVYIPFEILFGFGDQRGRRGRGQRISRRCFNRGWRLDRTIVPARCTDRLLIRRWRSRRDAIPGGRNGHDEEGEGRGRKGGQA